MTTTTPTPAIHAATVTLPVAPQAVARGRFTSAEQPGAALYPSEALALLDRCLAQGGEAPTVELSGPGDPLATPGLTLETLLQVRKKHPGLGLGITTLGLSCEEQAQTLADHGVTKLTLLVDAVDPEVVQQLFLWIRPAKRTIPLAQAAEILLSEQAAAIAACQKAGIAVTIRATVYPGVNDTQIEVIASQAAALGAQAMMVLPGLPQSGDQGTLPAPDLELMRTVRSRAARHLAVIEAPAEGVSGSVGKVVSDESVVPIPRASAARPNVAVVSSNGMEVDLHLGQASRILIYGPREDGLVSLLDTRPAPPTGSGASRWEQLADLLTDCFALLAVSVGTTPRAVLAQRGLPVLITNGEIEGTVDVLFGGGEKGKGRRGKGRTATII